MNPSYEYMERMWDEKHRELLSCERFAVAQRLKAVELPESGSHDMLCRVAYAVYPHAGPWDRESATGLVEALLRLIGDGRAKGCGDSDSGVDGAGVRDGKHETVTYDVLGNERHKVVCELKKLKCKSGLDGAFVCEIARVLDVPKDGAPYPNDVLHGLIRDRLIHLLGGDAPELAGLFGILKEDSDGMARSDFERGTVPCDSVGARDVPEEGSLNGRITSELRDWVRENEVDPTMVLTTYPPQPAMTGNGRELLAIADRIDAQFDRICHQQEAVLQSTIDSTCEERDELEAELEKTKELLEISYGKRRAYKVHIEQMKGGSKRLREELRKVESDRDMWHGKVTQLAGVVDRYVDRCNDLLDLIRDAAEEYDDKCHWTKVWHDRVENMREENDYLQKNLARAEQELNNLLNQLREMGVTCQWNDGMNHWWIDGSPSRPDTAENIVRELLLGTIDAEKAIERIEALRG